MSKTDPTPVTPAPKVPKGGLVLLNVPMDSVSIKKGFNPRTDLGDLTELKRSLSEQGMQQPLIVCPTKPGASTYYVIAGHRRFTVWSELGKANVPVNLRADLEIGSPEAFALAVAENSEDARANLTPLDQANAFSKMLASVGGDGNEAKVAKAAGYSATHVKRTLKLLLVPKAIKERLSKGEISPRAAGAIADVPDDIRDRVIARVGVGTTEGDVARMVNEVRREARAAGNAAPVAGRGQTATPTSRHNVPIGAAAGTWVAARGTREVRKMIEYVGANAINASLDIEDAVESKDDAAKTAAEAVYVAAANQLAALLWQVGGLDKLDAGTKEFKAALGEIRQRLEEKEKAAAPKAPKAAPAAASSGPTVNDDDDEG